MIWKKILIGVSIWGIVLIFGSGVGLAENSTELNKTITDLQAKIAELQGQENSLSKQIKLLNSNIELTTVKITATKTAIAKLVEEANELANEIERLELLLNRRSELVLKRIPESYKRLVVSSFGQLLFSENFSDFLGRAKYVATVQERDAQLLFQLKATQNNFSDRKDLRERKKQEQEVLKKQLEIQTVQLDRQKKDKEILLTQTLNSEGVYQKLLSQALAEQQALDRAKKEAVRVGPVKKGDPIALVGNTGWPDCSTGPHLHFEIQKNNSLVDPTGYLLSKTVLDVQDKPNGVNWTLGNGNWSWPLQDIIRLTQHYGRTPYSWRYKSSIHTGFDMVSNSSEVIRAPQDGTLYSSTQSCGKSSIIKIKYIDHGDGVTSFYLHVQ